MSDIYTQATSLLNALEVNTSDDNYEVAIDVIKRFGSYRQAMYQASKIEFKKKEALLFALLGNEDKEVLDDLITKKAKTLISACEQMNTILSSEAHAKDMTMDDYIRNYDFKNISDETKAILNNVGSHYDFKELIKKIRQYQTSIDAINAFKRAIKQHESGQALIANSKINQMIKEK